jgi:signal transduction histidine kinase
VPYRSIQDPAKLRRVLEATLLLQGDLELPVLLRHVIEEACSMTGARYGALGVLNDEGTELVEFITVGLTREEEERIGPRPTGRGVLGLLISDPRTVRLADLSRHPDSFGFPPNHPSMTSFLGVPLKVRDAVYGNLYLTEKQGWTEFTHDDEALVEALGLAAGIAIENARLHQRVREVAVYEDRDRLARDLHDTVIQRLFAIGLSLQSVVSGIKDQSLATRLQATIVDVDDTISQVRSSIFELGSSRLDQSARESVLDLVRALAPVVGFPVPVTFDGPIDTALSTQLLEHVLAVVREALTNVGRHARATSTRVKLSVDHQYCRLEVVDNGQGMGTSTREGGLGLANLRRRAEKLGGHMALEQPENGGTRLIWKVPLDH